MKICEIRMHGFGGPELFRVDEVEESNPQEQAQDLDMVFDPIGEETLGAL
jgi:hypothetical protein